MAKCPICRRDDIFGEQISYLNIISNHHYFDCPRCGAFTMTSRTRDLVLEMGPAVAEELLGWILEHNARCTVPMVSEHFVIRTSRSAKEKVLR